MENPNVKKEVLEIVGIDAVNEAFQGTNFGKNPDHFKIIADTLLKCLAGFGSGKMARAVCWELGLIDKSDRLTAPGKSFIFWYFYSNT